MTDLGEQSVAVIGSGFGGLSAACFLADALGQELRREVEGWPRAPLDRPTALDLPIVESLDALRHPSVAPD